MFEHGLTYQKGVDAGKAALKEYEKDVRKMKATKSMKKKIELHGSHYVHGKMLWVLWRMYNPRKKKMVYSYIPWRGIS